MANLDLWKTSGHCDFYSNDMFKPIAVEEEMYQIKPMNCPFHCLVYKDSQRSYRDLPIRWAELGKNNMSYVNMIFYLCLFDSYLIIFILYVDVYYLYLCL